MKPDPQLRLSLLALHRRMLFFGPRRNLFILLLLLFAITLEAMGYFTFALYDVKGFSYGFFLSMLPSLTFMIPAFILIKTYCVDLPAIKSILAYFEHHHPELCSWLPESALLEATMLHEQKAL